MIGGGGPAGAKAQRGGPVPHAFEGSKAVSLAGVEERGERRAVRCRGGREAGLWFHSKGSMEGRAGKPGESPFKRIPGGSAG